ncbi:hypothetical protein, partial [Pseudomonas viridiflava]
MSTCIVFLGCTSHRQGPRALAQARTLGLEVILIDTHDNIEKASLRLECFLEVHAVLTKDFATCHPLISHIDSTYSLVGIYTFEEF